MRWFSIVRLAAPVCVSLLGSGCITSSPGDYGATPAAKKVELAECPSGVLDDAEDGDSQIVKTGGRDGYWFSFADPSGSTIQPKGQFTMSPGGRPGSPESAHSARMQGRIAEAGESLYAGIGFALTNPKAPFDLSQAQGIQFWAKGPGRIRFKVPDVNTSPEGDRCTDCYNDFGVDLYLSDRWERYTVPFEALEQQPGWGDRAPHVASGAVYAFQWQFSSPGAEYDISVDDVRLVGCGRGK